MAYGITLSDLHLYSHHSRPRRYAELLVQAASSAKVLVLNGDIFDFKWSHHGVFARTVHYAERFLGDLAEACPQCRIEVVLGNHDANPLYMEALERLARAHERFNWHEFACILEDRVFLHGDVIHAGCTNEALRQFRNKLQHPANGNRIHRLAHGALHLSHVPWVAFRLLPKRILAVRLLTYLKNEGWLEQAEIRHIYFGHTHNDFDNFRFNGYLFHNAGSATHGARFRIVRFPLSGES